MLTNAAPDICGVLTDQAIRPGDGDQSSITDWMLLNCLPLWTLIVNQVAGGIQRCRTG